MSKREILWTKLVSYVDVNHKEADALIDAYRAEVLRRAAVAVEALDEYKPSEHRERTQTWLDGFSDGITEAVDLLAIQSGLSPHWRRRRTGPDTRAVGIPASDSWSE